MTTSHVRMFKSRDTYLADMAVCFEGKAQCVSLVSLFVCESVIVSGVLAIIGALGKGGKGVGDYI